eukprot:m.292079 g.292079  ORF g.292079 m.292079 type:complete len:67 (+) comp19993_c0_seq5:46-246(+)
MSTDWHETCRESKSVNYFTEHVIMFCIKIFKEVVNCAPTVGDLRDAVLILRSAATLWLCVRARNRD